MPTVSIKNVPEELYEAIRARARGNHTSIAAEILAVLAESVPTPSEIARRKRLIELARRLRLRRSPVARPFHPAEVMLREDRRRR